jgi:ParB/RepB/Spo0J family partition protein
MAKKSGSKGKGKIKEVHEICVEDSVRSSEIQILPLEEITEYGNNPRTHDPMQVQKIANSITKYGFVAPIIVDENCCIVAGHGRFAAAKLLGLIEVPVVVKVFPPGGAEAYRIADNELTDQSEWNMESLREEVLKLIEEFQYTPDELAISIGFETDDLDLLLAPLPTVDDLAKAQEETRPVTGKRKPAEEAIPDSTEVLFLFFESRDAWQECFRLLGGSAGVADPKVKQRTIKVTSEKLAQLRGVLE